MNSNHLPHATDGPMLNSTWKDSFGRNWTCVEIMSWTVRDNRVVLALNGPLGTFGRRESVTLAQLIDNFERIQ